MATYRYDGEPLTFPSIFKADGTQLVAEPGETYDLAEAIDDPRFTSVGSAAAATAVTSIQSGADDPAEPTVSPETPPEGPETPAEQESA